MNAVPMIDQAPRAERYSTLRFEAFRICDNDRTYPVTFPPPMPVSLREAVDSACASNCFHKDKLAIRETDTVTGAVKIHLYAIRKKAPQWVHQAGEIMPRRVEDLYADFICTLSGEVLLPPGRKEER